MQRRGALTLALQLQGAGPTQCGGTLAALSACLPAPSSLGSAEADSEAEQQQQQQQAPPHRRQHPAAAAAAACGSSRRLSHYAASPSGRASCAPSAAAALSRGRRFGTSAAAAARSSTRERGFASAAAAQPAYAYAEREPSADPYGGYPVLEPRPLELAQRAAARLKRQAAERMRTVRDAGAEPLGLRGLEAPPGARGGPHDGLTLRKVPGLRDEADEEDTRAVWERLAEAHMGRAATKVVHSESAAALQRYRQEVLHGQDPEVAMSSSPGGFVHIPFLRSGMFAAHQGYSLQSDLSRARLQNRLLDHSAGVNGGTPAPRAASSSRAAGLQAMMESSRGPGGPALPLLPGLTVALASADELQTCLGAPSLKPVRSDAYLHEEEDEAAAAARELLAWEEARRERAAAEANGSAARAGGSVARPWRHMRGATIARTGPRPRPDAPAAAQADVLAALAALPGVQRSDLEGPLSSLYQPPSLAKSQPRSLHGVPFLPLQQPADPEACLRGIAAVAELLLADLGAEGFVQLVQERPWVLLIDAEQHGREQLGMLHAMGLSAEQRRDLLRAFPGLLQVEVEGGLLAIFEYLHSLGMSGEQYAACLKSDHQYALPATLTRLKAAAAFWLGKGMRREDLVHFLCSHPRATFGSPMDWDLKLDWLADHIGLRMKDVALLPSIMCKGLVGSTGPRIAFALSRGYKFCLPCEHTSGRASSSHLIPLAHFITRAPAQVAKRCGATLEEFERFKQGWLAADFPAWLEQRKPGIDYYRSLTQKHRKPGAAADGGAEATRRAQQQEIEREQQEELEELLASCC